MDLIELPTRAGSVEAYVARPDGDEHPGVLFCMDAFGLRPQIAAMADRIASWGYVVLAPNLFHRSGTVAEVAPARDLGTDEGRSAFFEVVRPRIATLTTDRLVADLADYLAALRALPGVRPGPVGTTGYCMGARAAVRAAVLDEDVAGVGGFHGGGLVTDAPDSPHRGLARARARFVFGHADHDRSNPPEAVEALGHVLADAGLVALNEIYAGAAHGYTMADTSSYDEAAAERHFTELRRLLDETLGAAR